MSLLRFLNVQGIAGIAVSLGLALLLAIQKGETRHWKKESGRFEQLYADERAALAGTAANYRAAADAARAADQANLARVTAEQGSINERSQHEYETRLAAARLSAQRLRSRAASAPADTRAGGATPMPRLPAAPGGASAGAGQDRFSLPDRELATEQAIQLDELIKWVRRQHAVRVDGMSGGNVRSEVKPDTD